VTNDLECFATPCLFTSVTFADELSSFSLLRRLQRRHPEVLETVLTEVEGLRAKNFDDQELDQLETEVFIAKQ